MLLLLCVKYERKFNNNKSMTNIIKRRPLKKKKSVYETYFKNKV